MLLVAGLAVVSYPQLPHFRPQDFSWEPEGQTTGVIRTTHGIADRPESASCPGGEFMGLQGCGGEDRWTCKHYFTLKYFPHCSLLQRGGLALGICHHSSFGILNCTQMQIVCVVKIRGSSTSREGEKLYLSAGMGLPKDRQRQAQSTQGATGEIISIETSVYDIGY